MKNIQNNICNLIVVTAIAAMTVSFNACTSDSPLAPASENQNVTFAKKPTTASTKNYNSTGNGGMGGNGSTLTTAVYPQSNSMIIEYDRRWKQYWGSFMSIANGSSISVDMGALIPPEGTKAGSDVTITMTCTKDDINNEMIFTFGPCGSQFTPAATLRLSWSDLNIEIPKLYYIDENGSYIEQVPDDIDYNKKWMSVKIHHFSRYAFSWSE